MKKYKFLLYLPNQTAGGKNVTQHSTSLFMEHSSHSTKALLFSIHLNCSLVQQNQCSQLAALIPQLYV